MSLILERPAFGLGDITTNEGAPLLRTLQGWVSRTHKSGEVARIVEPLRTFHEDCGRVNSAVGSIVPALAKSARAGHPQWWWYRLLEGWATRRLAGIEVLDAVKRLGDPSAFKKVTLEDVAIAR
jgi:hypothetical protein